MTLNTFTISEVKSNLKLMAAEIKQLKSTRKSVPDGYVPGLLSKQHEFRHWHIAYCLKRGRTIEQIEKPREGNEHNDYLVQWYVSQIVFPPKPEVVKEGDNAETVCDSAR